MTDAEASVRQTFPAVSEKWGFGMAPPKPPTRQMRMHAAEVVIALIETDRMPERDDRILDAISTIKGLFNRILRQDQWDWFTVAGNLGYPSAGLSKVIAEQLTKLRTSLRDGDEIAFTEARIELYMLKIKPCLMVLLGRLTVSQQEGTGWVYILSTREFSDLIKVGMTTRSVEKRVAEINTATGVAIPFGVRRCWHVTDPRQAEAEVHTSLRAYRLRSDREFFRVGFGPAASIAQRALSKAKLEIHTLASLSVVG